VRPTADSLLERAAANDAARARDVAAAMDATALLATIVTQTAHALAPGRQRRAGIDAVAEAERARVELGAPGAPAHGRPAGPSPLVGWEVATHDTFDELVGATLGLHVRPWTVALLAFDDDPAGRRAWAVAADGRAVRVVVHLDRHRVVGLKDGWVGQQGAVASAAEPIVWGLANALGVVTG
jgi:hypothetical protein